MLALALNILHRARYAAGLALTVLVLAGCAQQREPDYYSTDHDDTQSDAFSQARGSSQGQAPSQIQLGFGGTAKQNRQANQPGAEQNTPDTEAIRARPLTEPKTFLGTVPCLSQTETCAASRVTLTLAPSGEWRARTVMLDGPANSKNTIIQQGCWNVIGVKPLKILLEMKNKNTKANLTFVNDNQLRVNAYNDITPNLEYHLTRQADIDAIDELHGQPTLTCRAP